MRILITGGAGFIGTNISLEALKQGYKVVIFDSFTRKGVEENAALLEKKGVEVIRGDIRKQQDLKKIEKKIDAIIHLAANSGIPWSLNWPLYDFEVNALGTLHILEYSKENGKIPILFASTNKIYSEEVNLLPIKEEKTRYVWNYKTTYLKKLRPAVLAGFSKKGINEQFPLDSSGLFPHSPYGVSKATADLYCQEYFHMYKIPMVINRMSCVYGLHQKGVADQGWIDWFIRAKIHNLPIEIYGDGKQVRDTLFGNDLAKLYLLELHHINKIQGMIFNLGGGIKHNISPLELIESLNKKPGKKLQISFKKWRPADQKIYISDNSKVKKILGWAPHTSVQEGINCMWDNISQKNGLLV